jgi:hypothetical protein
VRRTNSYILNELTALEREQDQIDKQARELEKRLRPIMKSGKYAVLLELSTSKILVYFLLIILFNKC